MIEKLELNMLHDLLNYDQANNLPPIAQGTVPNGYFGDRKSVKFVFFRGHTICVHESGYFDSGLPAAADEREAVWLLQKHPTARNIQLNEVLENF